MKQDVLNQLQGAFELAKTGLALYAGAATDRKEDRDVVQILDRGIRAVQIELSKGAQEADLDEVLRKVAANFLTDADDDWRTRFKAAVYENLVGAVQQGLPLEDYPDRIVGVLERVSPGLRPEAVKSQPMSHDSEKLERLSGLLNQAQAVVQALLNARPNAAESTHEAQREGGGQ